MRLPVVVFALLATVATGLTACEKQTFERVQEYNVLARSFPTNLTAKVFGYAPKANFSVQNEAQISTPPTVDFGAPKK